MKQPTKQELKDRIAELEAELNHWRQGSEYWREKCRKLQQATDNATIAAYALLATLFILVGASVIW